METAWTYTASSLPDEHEAVRTRAAIMDVSGLRKIHLVGPHSHHVLQRATTRDVSKIYPGRAVYACMLNDGGKFTDDCILYRTGPNSWFVVIGSGTGYEELTKDIAGKNASLIFDDDLQDLSLQGPWPSNILASIFRNSRPEIFPSHAGATLRLRCDDLTYRVILANEVTRFFAGPKTPSRSGTRL